MSNALTKKNTYWPFIQDNLYIQIKKASEILQMFDSLCMVAANKRTDAVVLADVSH